MRRENKSESRKQNIFFFCKASDCTLGVPNDYISILEIIKLQPTDRQRRTDQSSDRVEIDTLKKKERHQMEREIDL